MPSMPPGSDVTTASSGCSGTVLSLDPIDRSFANASSLAAIGALLRPATIDLFDLVMDRPALWAILLLTMETSAPVSMANANGPAPLIQPLTTNPAPPSSRNRIGRSEWLTVWTRCEEEIWAAPARGTAHALRKEILRARASLALLTARTSID
jgi:hypothetical protein